MKIKALAICIIGVLLLIQPLSAQTWTPAKRLTWNSYPSILPVIATDSNNNIHFVYSDAFQGNYDIHYKRSEDGGDSWIRKRLSWTPHYSYTPCMTIDSSNVIHVIWVERIPGHYEIYYKRSTDGGTSWTTKRLTWTTGDSGFQAIVTDSNDRIHIFWAEEMQGKWEIFYKKSIDGGDTWIKKRLTFNKYVSLMPAVAVDSADNIHLIWQDGRTGNTEIFYKKSTDGGNSWATKRLTWNSGISWYSSIAVDSNDCIHIAWRDNSMGNYEIFYKKSVDGGNTWVTKRLTHNIGNSEDPAVAIDTNDTIHIVWWDDKTGNNEIFYKKSIDGGNHWTTRRLTWNSGRSWTPALAIDLGEFLHVVWFDDTPGNWEIYYRKGIQ